MNMSCSVEHNHEYFINVAVAVSKAGTCDRAQVGCVLVKDGNVISSGYNGAPVLAPQCSDVGHAMEGGHCVRVIHAEERALIGAARVGVSVCGAVCYCTLSPCIRCAERLYEAGVRLVIYKDSYDNSSRKDSERLRNLEHIGFSSFSSSQISQRRIVGLT